MAGLVAASVAFAPALAQTPPAHVATEHPAPHKTPFQTFAHPSAKNTSVNATACGRNATAAQQRINPITGKPQAQTLVSVPLTPQSGSVSSATTRQQQIEACTHATH